MKRCILRKVSVIGVSAMCCLALAGCSGTNYGYTGGIAATVNGTEIEEDTITKYIQDFRTSADLESDDDWANWMTENSVDPETVRKQVIDYYVDLTLEEQACEENEITIDESQVDEQLEEMKSNYSDDDAWEEALASAGITEDQYRESIESGLREQQLMEAVAADEATASDDEVLDMLNTYYTMFDGSKKSSHILFASDDEETAQEVLDKINSGELDFAEAAEEYSTDTVSAADGGNVGWDAVNTFIDAYTEALDELSVGEVSGLVTSDYGIHIIKCTDEFNTDGSAKSLDEYPDEFVEYITDIVSSQNESTAYSEWFEEYENQAEIEINDMPENVPYNLDMTQYESSDDEATTDDSESDSSSDDESDDASGSEESDESSSESDSSESDDSGN